MLRRVGNKAKLAATIQRYFPQHDVYIELFFGGGGMFFNKPLAAYNIVNDIDSDVYNLYTVLREQKAALIAAVTDMPIHQSLFNYWVKNEEIEPLYKAVRFLMLSNFSLYGKNDTLHISTNNPKKILLSNIEATFTKLQDVQFLNCDFREVISKIGSKRDFFALNPFIYADPPYVGTTDNYSHSFTEQDSSDLFDILVGSGCRFAYSEFNHPFILSQAAARGLNVVAIGERQTLKARQTEVIVTNYDVPQLTLF